MFTRDVGRWLGGKQAVISGGGSGLGAAIAEQLAQGGADVWSIDMASEETHRTCGKGQLHLLQGDITVADDVERFCATVQRAAGHVDLLVNNAGIGGPCAPLQSIDAADFRRVMDVNVMGQVLLSQSVIPLLSRGGERSENASVVFISSAAGRLPYPLRTPYSTSKWGIVGLARTLAWELGGDGIRVNAVLPGIVDTPLARSVLRDRGAALGIGADEAMERFLANNALPTPVTVEDVVDAVLFLLSPLAGHITGQSLSVCGGADSIAVMR